jgi:hypothetical protein
MAVWPTVTDDDGSGTTGTILDNAFFNSVRDYVGGAWTTPAFNAANFTASGSMTWTLTSGDVAVNKYIVIGKTMHWHLVLLTTSVGGTASTGLRVALPGGVTLIGASRGVAWHNDNGTEGFGGYIMNSAYVEFFKPNSGSTWSATSTNNTAIYASLTFEIA